MFSLKSYTQNINRKLHLGSRGVESTAGGHFRGLAGSTWGQGLEDDIAGDLGEWPAAGPGTSLI